MTRYGRILFIVSALLLFVGCEKNHYRLQPVTNGTPSTTITEGKGELVIYRISPYGILKTPYLAANSQVFGQCSYKKAVFIELDSGIQTISVGSKTFDIQISEGQRTYASCIPWKLKLIEAEKGSEIVHNLEHVKAR